VSLKETRVLAEAYRYRVQSPAIAQFAEVHDPGGIRRHVFNCDFGFNMAFASAKQQTERSELSNQSWHIIRVEANVVFFYTIDESRMNDEE